MNTRERFVGRRDTGEDGREAWLERSVRVVFTRIIISKQS